MRVVLMHEKHDAIEESKVPVGAARDGQARGIVAKFFPEIGDVRRFELARDHHEIEIALDQLERAKAARVGRGQVDGNLRVNFLKRRDPAFRECREHIRRRALEMSGEREVGARHVGG